MLKNVSYAMYKVLAFFIFFDSIILKSYLAPLSRLRTIAFIILLIIVLISKKRCYPHNRNRLFFILFYSYIIINGLISIPEFISHGAEGFKIYKQLLLFPFFVYLFINFEALTKRSIQTYILFIIRCAYIWVIINFILYFVELPIWHEFRPWFGRISNGYPTVDVVCLNYALLMAFWVKNMNWTKNEKLFSTVLITLGIIVQMSGSGFVLLFLIYFSCLFISKNASVDKQLKKVFYTNIIVVCILSGIGLTYIALKQPELIDAALYVADSKFKTIFGKADELDPWADTMKIRDDEYEDAKYRFVKNERDLLFGIGYADVIMKDNNTKNLNGIFVEDQFRLNILTIGLLGQVLFLLYIFYPLWLWLKIFKSKIVYVLWGGFSIGAFLLASRVLLTMAIFQIEVIFALMFSFLLYPHYYKHPQKSFI